MQVMSFEAACAANFVETHSEEPRSHRFDYPDGPGVPRQTSFLCGASRLEDLKILKNTSFCSDFSCSFFGSLAKPTR